MSIIDTFVSALQILTPQTKSLRDYSTGLMGVPGQVALVHAGAMDSGKQAYKKQSVLRLRMWAEQSWCVRRAIDIHRNFAALVVPEVVPIDDKKPFSLSTQKAIKDLLSQRMSNGDSYAETKEKMLEDFFVVSHGITELWLKKNGRPYNITALDAATIAFYKDWDGSEEMPRYAQVDTSGKLVRRFGDAAVMSIVNRKRSYDVLGLSHIELLETAVAAIQAGDIHLLQELQYPSASGALALGEGTTPSLADEVRAKIMAAAKHTFVVISGTKDPKFIPFKPRDLKRLDKQLWFVRIVATLFGLPLSAFAQAADQNRANVTALLDQMGEGLKDTLLRIKNAENYDIVRKFGDPAKLNLQIDYPVLNSKDALKQAELTALQLADQPFASINEGRRANGFEKINLPIADDILINTSIGVIPLTALNRELYGDDSELDSAKVAAYLTNSLEAKARKRADVDGEIVIEPPPPRLLTGRNGHK